MSDELDLLFDEPDERSIDDAIRSQHWSEARRLLEDAVGHMPSDWHPLAESEDFVSGAFWDRAEFSAYTSQLGVRGERTILWVNPSYSRLWWQLAVVNSSEGLDANALTCLDRGMELEPDHPRLWIERGYVLNRMGRPTEALSAYEVGAVIRKWASNETIARSLRGQGYCLIELGRFIEARVAYLRSLELLPGNETAQKELEYIDQALKDKVERSKALPWFLHCIKFPPTDPLTKQLLTLANGLDPIPGPKTVGPENYSMISRTFLEHGWAGFEEAFDRVISRDRPDYADVKRDLLRESIFSTVVHTRMALVYLGKATVEEVFEEIEIDKGQLKLQ